MKKILLLIAFVFLLTGCVNLSKCSYQDIIKDATNSKVMVFNTYRTGYKYYLPTNMHVVNQKDYNEVLKASNDYYYLYFNLIEYKNKTVEKHNKNNNSIYFEEIKKDDKFGYIDITKKNDKYLVEIEYNYAKIEVITEEDCLNTVVANCMIVLTSIYYNDTIIGSLTEENLLNYSEENVNIFEKNTSSGSEHSNFLEYIDEYDKVDDEDVVPDYDLIN